MSLYELLDLALSLNNRLDTHWSLFITVHLALIGGIVYVDRPLSRNEKIGAIIIYTGFAIVNYYVMVNQIDLLTSIYSQIVSLKDHSCCTGNLVLQHILEQSDNNYARSMYFFIVLTHVVMYLVVFLSISYDSAKSRKKDER